MAAMPEISASLPASDRFAGTEGPDCKIVAKGSNLAAILGKEMRSGNAVCHVVVGNDIAAVIDDAVLGRSQDHIVMNQIGWEIAPRARAHVEVQGIAADRICDRVRA